MLKKPRFYVEEHARLDPFWDDTSVWWSVIDARPENKDDDCIADFHWGDFAKEYCKWLNSQEGLFVG